VLNILAITNSVNSGKPEVVGHLFSSCEHASVTNKSDSKVFKFSYKFQSVPSYVKVGIAELHLLKKTMTFLFCQC
jgi:hypothetical protein